MSFAPPGPPPFRSWPPQQGYPQAAAQQPYPQQPHAPQPYLAPSYAPHAYAQPIRDRMSVFQVSPQTYARGKNLVFWSRMLLVAGLLMSFAGWGVTGATGWGGGIGIGVLACAITVVVAAVVGTVGRRLQGRII